MLPLKEVVQLAIVSKGIFKVISPFICENFIFKYVTVNIENSYLAKIH